jgi:hypothetical protein
MKWKDMRHVEETENVYIIFRCSNPRGREDMKNLDVNGRIILKWLFKKCGGAMD